MTTHQVISDIKSALAAAYPEGEVRAFVRILFEEWMHYSTVDIYMRADSEVPPFMVEKMRHAVQRLLRHEPIQHIVGVAHFHGHRFAVSKHTLIPRPETEQLVDMIVDRNHDVPDLCVLDIGTGSGCIACSLARALRFAEVHAFDISQPALDLAAENARNLGVKVAFHHVDILNAVPQPQQFHIIVSNPPYVCCREKAEMESHVLDHEPHTALFVPDDDPLVFYRALAQRAMAGALLPGGWLEVEINRAFGRETVALFESQGLQQTRVMRDSFDNDRMVEGRRL